MDIQTKIKVNFHKWIRDDIYLKYDYKYADFSKMNGSYLGDTCFEFNEYQKITIELLSDNPEDYLKIESYEKEEMAKLNVGDEHILSPGGDSDIGLVPGNYQFKLCTNGITYHGVYNVIPCNINNTELTNMKDFMEKVCEGITYNLYLERNGYEKSDVNITILNLEAYKFLKNNYKQIINSLNCILKEPIINVESEYKLSKYSKRIDNKSLRWKCKQNGKQDLKSELFKEKRIIITNDNHENKIIKKIIERLWILANIFAHQYEIYLQNINLKAKELTNRIKEMKEELDSIKFLGNVKRRKGELKRDIDGRNSDLKNYQEKIKKVKKEIHDISLINTSFRRYLYDTWFDNISIKNIKFNVTTKLVKRYDYNYLYNIYLNIFKGQSNKKFKQTLSTKKTSLLYELYIFVITKNIFEEIGFKWTSGWLKSQKDIYTCDLESGESIILEQGIYRLEIIYDRFINRVRDVRGKNISEVVSNSERRRPDILINLYVDNKFIKSAVIEVKYRKKGYIYNKNVETDVMNQLIAYREFDYYDSNSKNNKVSIQRVVEKIITVFPSDKENDYYIDETYYFQFIPIKPLSDDIRPLGYKYLYNQLNEFVSDCE